ncbi:B-cell receptor CD22-like [Anguilla rostrata]|uniref:B-cell receptor CD22-like n=1 Tax=Anguilla rostrata TaxID=7938 RepID=UPI0030CB1666
MLFNTLLVIVLSVSGVLSQEGWGVTYSSQRICALKGSSVNMSCTYSCPTSDTVRKTFWVIPQNSLQDLSQAPEYSQRVEYLGKQNSDCAFRINQLRITDSGTYGFRFLTASNNFTGKPGVTLEVTDLQVMVNPDTETVVQSVTLTCRTTCTLTGSPAFIWYRDGSPLSFTDQSHQFRASSEDASKYSCAVKGYELQSPAVALNVRYPPKNTSVSVSPSGEIVEGSSVTLTCSSDASPPLQRYTWYKNNRAESSLGGSKWSYTINNIQSWDAGEYYCEAENVIGTDTSPHINLKVLYPPKSVSVSVPPSGEIVEGSSVTLTCSSDANPPVQRYTWYKKTGSAFSRRGSEQSYTINEIKSWDAGEYYCEAVNVIGTGRSPPIRVYVQYSPKSVSVSVSPSGEIVEGSSVTLTCKSDANPPVHKYTWYKKTGFQFSRRGSEQSYTINKIKSGDAGEYYCEAQNKIGINECPPKRLDVQYSPKSVSVSVSPSGEIVEGSSVTLTCSSDANPPVHKYTWYKKTGFTFSRRGSERSYTINKIKSGDAGEYYCEAQNRIGIKESPPKRLDVQYPPKSVSVSVSPSGEIVEGSSVTLTCKSDANPPVHIYTWYKKTGFPFSRRGSEQSYTINKIKSGDAGEYYCEAQNKIGIKESPPKRLDVQYPPKSVSVSVSPSGEIEEGSSVTLTCSSDANPPVKRYTWYQNNRTVSSETGGPVDSYTIKNITLQDAGEYYCEAGNGIGTNRSPPKRLDVQSALQVTVQGGQSLIAAAAVGVAAILALVFLGVVCVRRRKSTNETERGRQGNKSPIFGNVSGMAMSHTGTQGHQPHP